MNFLDLVPVALAVILGAVALSAVVILVIDRFLGLRSGLAAGQVKRPFTVQAIAGVEREGGAERQQQLFHPVSIAGGAEVGKTVDGAPCHGLLASCLRPDSSPPSSCAATGSPPA